jgi:phenylalanyl-tRNA synthetase alpha chain
MLTHQDLVPLTPAQLSHDLEIPDLSDPADGPHAIQQLVAAAASALARGWQLDGGCQVRWCRGSRIVPAADNYDGLGYARTDVTREVRYSRYVDDERMLRSHSTALIPAALRQLASDPPADVLLVCPAMVYRRDSIDRLHTGTPHQLDLWRVGRRPLRASDLDKMISVVLAALVPGMPVQHLPRRHPYTCDGRQLDVWDGGEWVEVGECGLAHPDVLALAGIEGCSGLAMGLGLDRLLMLRKGIPDIRLLRSADPLVAAQMQDLTPYRTVSRHPAIRRDLSVAVDSDTDAETLGDQIRAALDGDADAVEDVHVLSSTDGADLPQAAIDRLGLQPGQQNLLLRVVLRKLDTTLTDAEANLLRDRIYQAVHRGTNQQWAARSACADPVREAIDVHRAAAQKADQGQPGIAGEIGRER